MFRGKLYWDRFKNKLSEYILSPSFVFKLPSAPLSLVFSHGGGGGGEEKFLPWFGGEPLRDPSRGVIPRGGLLLPSSARTEPRAARLKERSLAETCCRSPRPEGRGTLGLLAPTVVHPPERPGPVGITTVCLNHCAAV